MRRFRGSCSAAATPQLDRKDIGTYSVEALVAMTGRPLEIITGVRAARMRGAAQELVGLAGVPGRRAVASGRA